MDIVPISIKDNLSKEQIVYVIVMILVVYNLLNAPRDYDE